MKFDKLFKRAKNAAGAPALGSDVAPTTAPGASDNQTCVAAASAAGGFPTKRIAVGCLGPSGAPTADLYIYDLLSSAWYKVGSSVSLPAGSVTAFAIPALVCRPGQSLGAIDVCLVPAVGTAADGLWTFTLSADCG